MNNWTKRRRSGFSLLELVIVIVIMGIVAAVAIPRMSRGSAGASDAALGSNLSALRTAVDLYASEHGGAYPAAATFSNQMTLYTSTTGATNATKTSTYLYGPYLRKVPTLPVGPEKGSSTVAASAATGVGWVYTAASGDIQANTGTLKDAADKLYTAY